MKRCLSFLAAIGLLAASVTCASAQERPDSDPIGAYNFVVEIEGINAGYFKNVDGLSAEIEVIEYQDGDDLILRKRPGRAKFGDITLKKGYIVTEDLQSWWRSTIEGKQHRRNVQIHLQDPATKQRVATWNLIGCWPKQWKLSGFDGKGNDALTEEITLVVEDIRFGK